MNFTPLYDWVLSEELTLLEAALVCRVLRWGENGCYESSRTLARLFKSDPRTIQRTVKRLVQDEWLAALYPDPWHRVLFINPSRLNPGPLFDLRHDATLGDKSHKNIRHTATQSEKIKE